MEAMFFEHGCRDERQLVNGLAEFRGHASHSYGYEANSSDGVRNLQQAIEPTGFLVPTGSSEVIAEPLWPYHGTMVALRSDHFNCIMGVWFPTSRD